MLLFMKVLFTQFIAEMGDKTQLMLVAMTSRFKLKDILLGTGVAVLVLNGLAVLAGGIISTVVPTWLIRLIAGAAFLFFAVTTLKGDDDEEENVKDRKIKFAPLSVFCTFFVAELGDKTQLTAITFGANEGLSSAVVVWLACSLTFCSGCDRTSDRISSEKQGTGGNPQYSCICYFFHLWNPDAETGIWPSARGGLFYDPSTYRSGYGCVCDRLSCAL